MHKYDYSFLKDFRITSKLVSLSNVISETNFKLDLQKKNYPDAFAKLHERAVVDSTVSSNRIEGVETSEKRIKELFNESARPFNHDEQEISGYRDAVVFISDHHQDLSISEKTIRKIHEILMYYTDGSKGKYKTTDNQISARYEDGSYETVFSPVKAEETEKNIRELVKAYQNAKSDYEINPMLLIPCFIVDFLSIHPFSDGNGRVSRLLTLLMLYNEGYDVGKYISYEKMIEEYQWNYYQELNRSQIGWHENQNDYSAFIVFHFQILYRCFTEISRRFTVGENDKKLSKKKRIENVLRNTVIPISKSDIAEALPDVSITTIENTLNQLLKQEKIVKIGSYKDARYIGKEEI